MTDPARLDGGLADAVAYVTALVRQADQDRYWSALLAPEPARTALLALYAFDVELARIADEVSEPHIGLIRLKWWHDAVGSAIGEDGDGHPLIRVLLPLAAKHGVPRQRLAAIVEAREAEFDTEGFADFGELEEYLVASAGGVLEFAGLILSQNGPASAAIDDLVRDAAIATGLAGLVRALPWHAAHGRVFLPRRLLSAHGLHPDAVRAGNDNPDLRAALRDVVKRAEDALLRFRAGARALPRELRPAFLPVALVGPILSKAARPGRAPFRDLVQLNPLRRYLLIWKAYLSGRF
jgi:15-cis-phytoene synthase